MAVVISLSGSLVTDKNTKFLREFKNIILNFAKKTRQKVIITVGGGSVCREYQAKAKKISNISQEGLDWIGIMATRMNAEFVKAMFGDDAHKEVIYNPSKKVKSNKKVIIAAGYKPGWSTDYDAVLLAKNFNANTLINLSNIDYVYDKDPKKYKNAKRILSISWKDFQKIVGKKWSPGLNMPFDPVASKLAKRLKLNIIIANGEKLKNLRLILQRKRFIGTIIS